MSNLITDRKFAKYCADFDCNGLITEFNEEMISLTGYKPSQLESGQITFFDLIPPEDRDEYLAKVKKAQENGGATLEHRILCADGSRINVICIGNDYVNSEGHGCVSIILSDITDRVALEKRYISSQNEIEALVGNMIGGVVLLRVHENDTEVVKASGDYYDIIGGENSSINSVKPYITEKDKDEFFEKLSACVTEKTPFEETLRLTLPGGEHRWLVFRGRFFQSESDDNLVYCTVMDNTATVKAEKMFRKQSLCFKMITENSEQFFFDYDSEEDEFSIFRNKSVDVEEVTAAFLGKSRYREYIHEKDCAIFREVFEMASSEEKKGTVDVRTNAFDDDYRWYRLSYESVQDDGGYYDVYGIITCIDRVKNLKSRLAHDEREIKRLTTTDPVTFLFNRTAFITYAAQVLKETYTPDECFAVVYSDINDFSYVNENFGYEAGNKMLYDFAEIIRSCEISVIGCRIYSDFFVSLYRAADRDTLIQSISERNKNFTDTQKKKYPSSDIKISAGIYFIHSADEDITIAIDNANLARRSVKGSSDVPSGIYTERMRLKRSHDQAIASEIWNAINTGAIELFLQPKFDMQTRKIIGAEALSRWRNPDGSYKMPYEFIDVLENIGHITHLDFYIYEQVLKYLAKWKNQGKELFPISINFSRKHNNYSDFVERVNRLAEKYDIDKKLIEIEITESCFTKDVRNLFVNMKKLRDSGFRIDIDDFGTGYSSLSILMSAPVDIVKVDKAFIDDIVDNDLARDYINHICRLIKSTNKEIIFEGVESEQQAKILTGYGHKMAQGWLFDKAIPVTEFEKKYLS